MKRTTILSCNQFELYLVLGGENFTTQLTLTSIYVAKLIRLD